MTHDGLVAAIVSVLSRETGISACALEPTTTFGPDIGLDGVDLQRVMDAIGGSLGITVPTGARSPQQSISEFASLIAPQMA